jgi:transposase
VCGYAKEDLKLSDREWTCPVCGARHDRDHNAAKNIFIEGQEVGRDAPPKPVEKRTATFSMRGRDPRRKGKSFSVKQVAKVSGGLV